MRRAAVSIVSNIAEGAARNSRKEFIHFLYVALGSLSEVETQLIISKNLDFLDDIGPTAERIDIIRKLINGLIYSLKEAGSRV